MHPFFNLGLKRPATNDLSHHDCCDTRLSTVDHSLEVRHIMSNWEEGPERQDMLDRLGGHQRCDRCKYVNHVHHCDCFCFGRPSRRPDSRYPRNIAEDVAQFREMVRKGDVSGRNK